MKCMQQSNNISEHLSILDSTPEHLRWILACNSWNRNTLGRGQFCEGCFGCIKKLGPSKGKKKAFEQISGNLYKSISVAVEARFPTFFNILGWLTHTGFIFFFNYLLYLITGSSVCELAPWKNDVSKLMWKFVYNTTQLELVMPKYMENANKVHYYAYWAWWTDPSPE